MPAIETGPLWTTLICFGIGYGLSHKRLYWAQIGVGVLLGTQFFSDNSTDLGRMWASGYFIGLVAQKIGLRYLVLGLLNRLKDRFIDYASPQPKASPSASQQTASPPPNRQAQADHDQKAFQERERKRYEQARAKAKQAQQQQKTNTRSQQKTQQKAKPQSPPNSSRGKPNQSQQKSSKSRTQSKPPPSPARKKLWYEVLEVSEFADARTVKKAYRAMVKKFHPDTVARNPNLSREEAEERMKEINGAYARFEEIQKRR